MKIYLSILRGINVSGHKMIKMDALKQIYSDLGFLNVQTYIQSGNVVFQSKSQNTNEIATQIEEKITAVFNFEVPVLVIEFEELKSIITQNPFTKDQSKDTSFFHVTFLKEKSSIENFNKIKDLHSNNDEFQLIDKSIFLYCPNGYRNTKLNNNFFENKLKTTATTRNWKTVNELAKIAEKTI
ncbi:MAG TPA: DUF1697 domain-containing protein [Bacteroidales bacterium]|nr:MAG: hypothetical protein A2W98_08040 [Bacteroidetes bacterium GWF2_33_38]OFY73708.1 MAG: hypothetical protein A2265_06395 [Bacteroidetes bacterium RIFOXYA12_FULL_33_9]HBF87351.1 DUF1697 domain-containing protein [Bacteroidales bacterium]